MEYIAISEGAGTAIVSTPPKKKFKCPYCDQRFERQKLHIHIQNDHEDLIPEGYTALRVAFNSINNKTEGHCIICKNITDWNENKGRYERLCNNPACHEAYKKMAADRNKNKYGVERLQTDPTYAEYVQKKALEGRRMAGKYKFADGGEVQYLGTYERKFLEFMDRVMHCKSEDIIAPGPSIEYEFEGKKHLYIPDFYYEPYELIVEIKDGGSNPNTHPKRIEEEKKNKAKEEAVKAGHIFNYVRVVNNDFGQLLSIMAVIKFQMVYHKYYYPDPVIRVNENVMNEDMSGTIAAALPPTPTPHECNKDNYYIVQHPQNNVFAYGITKDPVQNTIYGVDPQEPGFYKAYKTDKTKIDKRYLTFKIKDSQSAKELYDELALLVKSKNPTFHDDRFDSTCYAYSRLTEGSKIVTPDQLLFDSRFELVKSPNQEIQDICQEVYAYLKGPTKYIDILEEQVNLLERHSEYDMYNVMPEGIDNIDDLMRWKYKFDEMPYEYRMVSNDMSTDMYGLDNINRFNKRYSELINLIDPITNKIVRPEETRDEIEAIMRSIDNISESNISSDVPQEFYDNWDSKIQKVKEAESQGLIIMILPDAKGIDYTEDSISILKEKWNQLQSLPEDKRVLSGQTASSIFGIDNDGLYSRILALYTERLQGEIKDNPGEIAYPENLDPSKAASNSVIAPYFNPGEKGNYISSNPDVVNSESGEIDPNKYSQVLKELCLKLKNTSDSDKRELLKNEIYDLGWNPEIPYTEETAKLANLRYISYSNIQELNAEDSIKEAMQQAVENVPKELTSEYLKDKIVPVFVILCHGVALHSKGIMWFTDSEWSHASLSFDSSLDEMYTFTTNIDNAPNKHHRTGFAIDTKERYKKQDPHMKVKVYALFITPEQKAQMQEAVQWYIKHQDETKYGFKNLLNIFFRKVTRRKSGDECRMVCSQFVYTILSIVNFRLRNSKDSSLVSPGDIDKLSDDSRFYVVYQGEIDRYNKYKVDDLCYRLLPTLPMELYGINEATGENLIRAKSALSNSSNKETIEKVFEMAEEIMRNR